jgi:hypothetical protein
VSANFCEFFRGGDVIHVKERATGGHPPVTVPVEVDVASGRSILSAQNDCRIRQQSFEALPWTAAPERLIQKTRRECELVTLAGQTKRLNFAQRQQTAQIVTTTERSRPFKWTPPLTSRGCRFISDIRA